MDYVERRREYLQGLRPPETVEAARQEAPKEKEKSPDWYERTKPTPGRLSDRADGWSGRWAGGQEWGGGRER